MAASLRRSSMIIMKQQLKIIQYNIIVYKSYVISLVNLKNSFTDSLPNNLKSLSFEETLALQNRMSKKKAITFDGFDDK